MAIQFYLFDPRSICVISYKYMYSGSTNKVGCDSQQQPAATAAEPEPEQPSPALTDVEQSSKTEWTHSMIQLLLELYRSHHMQFRSAKHARNVWMQIADGMNRKGYKLTWQLCGKKFRNMKGTYKDIKDNNGATGQGRKKWPYFEIFQELLSKEPAISPSVAEMGAKRNVEPGDDTEPVSHLTEPVASARRLVLPLISR